MAFWAQQVHGTGYIRGRQSHLEAGGPKITLSHLVLLENEAKDVRALSLSHQSAVIQDAITGEEKWCAAGAVQ